MNQKTATKLAKAIQLLDEAIWLCESEFVDGITIRERRWQINDLLNERNYDVIEDSRGYHAVKKEQNEEN
jgi:hypothetical protein